MTWVALLVVLCGTPGMATESSEVEPNDAAGQATALGDPTTGLLVEGNVFPADDVGYWSFTAQADDRVSVAAITASSAGNSDSQIEVLAANGITVLEGKQASGAIEAAARQALRDAVTAAQGDLCGAT
ncbi:MAG TPA: hypothetical protein VGR62_20535 [Candidatus Binatia bacterium]|jgi:hypothetical protein|nr:hypothetical protein [Candidatus Binatia bacterium]